ncbi:hypothetical protein EST38_g7766 [Candolleomyces aberdarensis]|uniref:Palmitoyltransferase PFA5 n=1 Tax=Candolleomyces aberdarensis TaxID=2316362 RepID=A0A4Q2DHR7_9AGAR|nr:hypothetical protein EST38_g7766 [Candolleomyces aberdarensis]
MSSPNATTTSTADPNGSTSSPANNSNSTVPLPVPVLPGGNPSFSTEPDATYANVTIDDFSPLFTYSGTVGAGGDWLSPLTDSQMSAARPVPQRDWFLGTYRRTQTRNATIRIEFWGSEIHLYGDTGPAYGAYSLQLDQGTPDLRSAFYPALAVGPAHYLHSLRNLTEGRHELVITNLGTREGLVEGEGFLLDYVLVTQKVGPLSGEKITPGVSDVKGNDLGGVNRTGSWSLSSVDDNVVTASGQNANQPKTFYSTTENGASITHSFNSTTAIQVFGTRNATHGVYRATLSSSNSSEPLSSQTYNASAPCDFPGPEAQNVLPGCEWQGSVLKFSAANLDPALSYQLRLENVDNTSKVFDVDLIRTFDAFGPFPLPGFTDDSPSNNNTNSGNSSGNSGAFGRTAGMPGNVPNDGLRAPPAAFTLSGSEGREGRANHKAKRSSFSMTSTVAEGVEQGPVALSTSKSGSSASKFAENSTQAHTPTSHGPSHRTSQKKKRAHDEHSCCGVVQESAMRAREDRYERHEAASKPQPWIVLKMVVFITLGIIGYAAYVYVGLLVLPMIQRRRGAEGSRETGIGLLVGFAVLWLWAVWAYFMVVVTPPGYAKDYVQKTEKPKPPQGLAFTAPRHTIGGPSYEDMQAMLVTPQPQIPATTIPRPTAVERSTSVMTVKSISMQSGNSKSNGTASGIRFNSGEMMNGNPTEEVREAESSYSENEQPSGESRGSLSLQGILNEDVEAQVAKPTETGGGWAKWLFCCCWWMDSGDVAKPRTYIARRPPTTPVLEPLHRYCDKDGFLKPYRAHHCRNCGTCVLKYDHHCPWIGQCVGARNHKFFLNFCQAAFFCTAYIIGTMLPYTVKGFTERGANVNPQQLVLVALSALFALFTFSLTVTHIYMIMLGQTTVENMQIQTMKRREDGQLGKAFKWWEFRGKRQMLKEWDREWGSLDKEGNIWWVGGRRREWEAVMGKNMLGWILPIGKSPNDGLDYPVNPRFEPSSGRWRRRDEWPEELR